MKHWGSFAEAKLSHLLQKLQQIFAFGAIQKSNALLHFAQTLELVCEEERMAKMKECKCVAGFLSIICILCFTGQAEATSIGVNYGTLSSNLPSPSQVVELIKSTSITKVKLYNCDPSILHAFAKTGISIIVGIGNEQLQSLTNPTTAQIWVKQNIAAFMLDTKIEAIAVGNEVLTTNKGMYSALLLPAITNLHSALVSLGLQNVKVTTPHAFSILAMSYPPSSGAFRPEYLNVMKPLLDFLSSTGSPLMMNAYPYFSYHNDPVHVPLDYALFRPCNGITDAKTKLHYSNMFDAQLDAAFAAMDSLGCHNVEVVVSESGWPSKGGADEPAANYNNALTYNRNLISHLASNAGTPMRPKANIQVYIFSLFNENLKPGPFSEKNYGLFNVDGSAVYDLGIVKSSSPAPPPAQQQQAPHVWCVAKPNVEDALLLKGINFACGEGSADCLAIQKGGGCYNPVTMNSHASYAFNSYYQKHGRNFWNCHFSGTSMLSITDPSYGTCKYLST